MSIITLKYRNNVRCPLVPGMSFFSAGTLSVYNEIKQTGMIRNRMYDMGNRDDLRRDSWGLINV